MKKIITTLTLTAVSMAFLAASAKAITTSVEDMVLGFRQTNSSDTGNGTNLEVDLGNWKTSGTFNLLTDLQANYGTGTTWQSSTLMWGVVATDKNLTSPTGSPLDTLWASIPSSDASIQAPGSGSGVQQTAAGSINSLRSYLSGQTQNTSIANGLTQGTAGTSSYTYLITHNGGTVTTNPFGFFTEAIENNTSFSSGDEISGLYEFVPGQSSATQVGTFDLNSSGVLTYTAVPEPSTFAMFATGLISLFGMRRMRRSA